MMLTFLLQALQQERHVLHVASTMLPDDGLHAYEPSFAACAGEFGFSASRELY
jgi:hypothetical protein